MWLVTEKIDQFLVYFTFFTISVALNGRIICKWWVGKDVESDTHNLTLRYITLTSDQRNRAGKKKIKLGRQVVCEVFICLLIVKERRNSDHMASNRMIMRNWKGGRKWLWHFLGGTEKTMTSLSQDKEWGCKHASGWQHSCLLTGAFLSFPWTYAYLHFPMQLTLLPCRQQVPLEHR
jgi:hypothetical protein